MHELESRLAALPPEARRLLELRLKREKREIASAPVRRGADRAPLSFAQRRLWFLDRLEPGSLYNSPLTLRVHGALDAPALERALGEVVRRHEALRSVIRADGAREPEQVILPHEPFVLAAEDLSGVGAETREEEVRRRVDDEIRRPFDLARGPLFRAHLLRLESCEHVLVLAMHHVVSDGWSLGVLFRELGALYEAFSRGAPSPLAELPLQYADYAAWQREHLHDARLEAEVAWWRRALAGAPAVLELPSDRPRPPLQSHRGARLRVALPHALAEEVRALARREGATPFMVMLAAFHVLLWRWSGEEDVVVGSPVAGRTRAETEGLIGFFVNTLALRADLSGDPPFRGLLHRVREATLGAYQHQELPFERLVEALHPERSLSHTPVFQTVFALQNATPAELALPGLRMEIVHTQSGTARFDLEWLFWEREEGITGTIDYATDLFDVATVERMAGQYRRLLECAVARPNAAISTLPLLDTAERELIVHRWNDAARPAPEDGCIHRLFERQARRTPDAVAVVDGESSLTYATLDARAGALARRLRALGVGPEVRVGLCLDRSPEIVVAILGVLKAGGAYVPVDPAYPPDRVEYLLADSGVVLVITQEETRASVPTSATAPMLTVDALLADDAADWVAAPCAELAPENAAYVIYTSGSTGRPKGVVVTHANVLRLFSATDGWFGFGVSDVWTLFHSYAFDFSVWEIWGALLYGGRLVIVPFHTSRDPAAFRELLARERVTVLNQTPSAFHQLVRADEGADGELALRWVVFGGEALEPRALKPWFDRRGDRHPTLVNMYGITETTVHVTYRPVTAEDAESPAGSRIGEGLPDLGVYLLDARTEPVPVGVPGELFVGGAGVARGYLGRPALTAQRFVPDPFSGIAGARMYRSGDRGRLRSGGDMEYMGRADQQVKVRGFRIEPGEIEAALLAHPSVRETLVLAREDEPGVRRLIAYVVADAIDADSGIDVPALRLFVAARLPDYMVPAAFVRLDALPLTPHGKVDRHALPAPDGTQVAAEVYVAPSGPVEETLAAVWAETLHVERVGTRDNFFALGGDSMRAIQLLALSRARGIPFSLQDLFRHQTVAELAAQIQPEGAEDVVTSTPFALLASEDRARLPEGVEDAYPMTQMQLGMLYHTERTPGQAVYHNVQTYHVDGAFDEARLRGALATLTRRHPILRTSFDLGGFSEPMQLVHRDAEIPLIVDSLAELDAEAQDAAVDAWVRAERGRPFDWRTAPLIRFHIHVLGADAFQFGFAEHHAILDGWSVAALQTELSRLYFDPAAALDEPAPAPALRDFAALEREMLASAEARAFWAEVLDDAAPVLPASLGLARGAGNRARRSELPAEVAGRLAEAARGAGLPLKSVFLAAHLRVLALASGVADVTSGVVVNGRPETADAERALGLFLNTVPFRVRLGGGSWMDLVRAAFRAERRMLPFRRFPAAELQRMRGGEPAFAALFNFVHFHVMDGMASGGARVGGARSAGGTDFPFGISFEVTPSGVHLYMEYDTARYTDGEADRLLGWYLDVLRRMAADPDARYDTALVVADDLAPIAESGSPGSLKSDADAETLHGLVAARAARTPDALALVCGGRALRYGELHGEAGRLARVLRERGVGPEVRVAVCCARSPEMAVGMLGVLRAGGAVVPLDSAYPAASLAFILADADVQLVLTDAATAGVVGAFGVDALVLDGVREGGEEDGSPLREIALDPRSAAYVIYTSGSTGTPKGVVVEHGAAAAHVAAFARELALSPADRVLHFASAGFDVSIEQTFLPLAAGATLVLREGEPWSPAEWAERTATLGITVANLAPAYWTEVIAASEGRDLPDLRVMLVGADAMPFAGVRAWRTAVRTSARLMNAYGPTEAVITATVHDIAEGDANGYVGAVVPIGRALPGRAAYVLDAFGTPAPAGVPGELCLGGALLARGYSGRPALTAERFVPDPFSATPGARMYRTGDRARRLADGAIEFLGRLDAQVKVRGFRIEPGEVEAALALHPAVREAAVIARDDTGEGPRLVAYVAAPGGDAPSPAELRAHLRARLPEHMVPAAFVVLDALPLTPNGKLNRRSLPAPEAGRGADAFVDPRDALELRLARLWAELLGADAVGVRDDFFALGGHSLVALRLMASVERMTGRRVPMATLLAGPTVERLAAALRAEEAAAAHGPLVPIQPGGGARPLFFVHAAGGNVLSYAALARHLGPDQPFYGLQSRGLERGEPVHARIEDMAADYLAELRAVQPVGPYRLGGWSMGGLVAFEMARMLHAAGQAVELLALLDTPAPGGGAPARESNECQLLGSFMLHLGLTPEQIARAGAEVAALPPADRLKRAWQAARAADLVPADLPLPDFERLWTVYSANAAAAAAYQPTPGDAGILLVSAEDRPAPAVPEETGWAALTTGTVRTVASPGDHLTMVREPHVRALAAVLADAIASSTEAGPAAAHT